jgi:hypothetical protein
MKKIYYKYARNILLLSLLSLFSCRNELSTDNNKRNDTMDYEKTLSPNSTITPSNQSNNTLNDSEILSKKGESNVIYVSYKKK